MSKTPANLRENLFTAIAKLLASAALKREFSKRDLENDQSLKATMESLKFHAEEFERSIKTLCDRFPNNPSCKNRKKR